MRVSEKEEQDMISAAAFGASSDPADAVALGAPAVSKILAVVGEAKINAARDLLWSLGEKMKGSSLTLYQRRQLSRMAPAVALRRARGTTPVLSTEQATQIVDIIRA